MTVREIEDRFLRAIAKADFLYVYCPEGYIGASAGFEVGYALASETPVYASDPPDFIELAGGDLELKAFLEQSIMVAGVAQAAQLERAKRDAAN